jgi:hypothetical protein
MVDITSIVVAAVSALGALLAASFAGWVTIYSNYRNRLSESYKPVQKYRDPLLFAAEDLNNFIHIYLKRHSEPIPDDHKTAYPYFSFVVGQYFSWTYILRRKAQFHCFATDKGNANLVTALSKIQTAFSETGGDDLDKPFTIWRGQQMAIAEAMLDPEGDELFCVGFGSFKKKMENKEFSQRFSPITYGTARISEADTQHIPDHRLRHIQHLLSDLILILDPKRVLSQERDLKVYKLDTLKCTCFGCVLKS